MTTMQTQLDDLENAFLEVFEPGFSKRSNASSFNKIKPRRRIITPRQRTIVLHGPPTNTMSQQLEVLENAFLEAIEPRHVTSHLHSVNNEIKPVGSWWNTVRDTIDLWWSCVKVTVGSWWNNVKDIPVIEYTSIQPSRGDISFVLHDKSMEEKCILVDDASDASTDVGERSDEEEDKQKSTRTKISSRINTIVPAVTVMQSLTSWIGFGCEMFGWVVEC